MKIFKKFSRVNRGHTFLSKIFLVCLPISILLAIGVIFISGKKFLADADCGCGPPGELATGEFETAYNAPVFNNKPVYFDLAMLMPKTNEMMKVLGVSSDDRWIEVDLSDQKLYAREGTTLFHECLVSGGKWAPTPTGEFRIWSKFRYTKMEGGKKEINTYYYLPNVPYTQFFYKGYGLHGAYWHNNFGQPMSHGCVNLAIADAEKLFYWTSPELAGKKTAYSSKEQPGTRVIIHE